MRLVNLTKKPCLLYDTAGVLVEVPPDPRHLGLVAVSEHRAVRDEDGHTFSLNVRTVTDVKGMPDPEDGTVYLVPTEVAMVLQGTREDVVYPAEEAQVRSAEGHLQRVTHLRRLISRVP